MKNEMTTVLTLYPNAIGVGYACLKGPKKLLDSGIMRVYPLGNDRILKRIIKFVAFYKPTIIMVQGYDGNSRKHSKRVERLTDAIAQFAKDNKIPVYRYLRQQIKDVFEQFGAQSKYDIAKQITVWFPQLAKLALRFRKHWMNEDYSMGVFDAVSLAITHQYLTE